MTEVDESLLTIAKLREQVRGDLDTTRHHIHDHGGVVEDDQDRVAMSFLGSIDGADSNLPAEFVGTSLGSVITAKHETDAATRAVNERNASLAAHLVGVTEQELCGSSLRLPMLIDDRLDAHGAPAFVLGCGNPNTGKTNTMSLLAELRQHTCDDLMILSNVRSWDLTDEVITSAFDLAVTLLENRDVPKFVMIDESSTHFDARVFSREVAVQWTPLAKRMAKIGVDVVGQIGHTGKDLHPEIKRLCNFAYFKTEPTVAEFYERWPADVDFPQDRLFGGSIEDLEPTAAEYDPNDAAPWSWNLPADLFARDLSWSELLDALHEYGPAN